MYLLPCDYEEADSRMCIHVKDAVQKGAQKILVRTVDTDVVIIIAGVFFRRQTEFPELQIWIGFGTGKHFKHYFVNEMCQNLGDDRSKGLLLIHAFSWSDTPSHCFGRGNLIQRLQKLLSQL